MRPIRIFLWGFPVLLLALWSLADTWMPQPFNWFSFRRVFLQASGVVAFGAMSLCMLLAARPRRVEAVFGGLDKMYRLHKWLGILALVAGTLHWWFAQGTKWMVEWGWLVRPQRPPRGAPPPGLEGFFRSLRGLAGDLGEWAFYAAAVFIVLALVKRFPYRLFARTHKWIALAYLALALHMVVLLKFDYWKQPIGWVMAILLVVGCWGAVMSLSGWIGRGRKVKGRIGALKHQPLLNALQLQVRLDPGWPGHAAGQFAFLTLDPAEGAHPFTITSAWNPASPELRFVSKALGDYTATLADRLKTGMPVTVEGPYGRFDFIDDRPCQIWVAGGVGITPFIARMQARAATPAAGRVPVHLFHATRTLDPDAIRLLEADARAADVHLHVLHDERDGPLTGARIRVEVPDWENASLWFCGPAPLGAVLRRDFVAHGLPSGRFHQELFQMR